MKLKGLFIAIPALVIVLLNILYGSAVSWMLSIGIIACLLYFFAQIGVEQIIFKKTNVEHPTDELKAHAAKVIKKYKRLLSFSLMTVVFLSAVFCVYRTVNPGGGHPYFLNNDYHAISNKGIAFNRELVLTETFEDDDSIATEGSLHFVKNAGGAVSVSFDHFYKPVFVQTEDPKVFRPVNNIFPVLFRHEFSLYNAHNKIHISLAPAGGGLFGFLQRKKNTLYAIEISSDDPALAAEQNTKLPYTDHISMESKTLEEGKSLYNLLLNSVDFKSDNSESYAVLEFMLRQLGDSYLLVNSDEDAEKAYSVFPDQPFFRNGWHLQAEGKEVAPQLRVSYNMPKDKAFFIGFHNQAAKNTISDVDNALYGIAGAGSSTALLYDYPAAYTLSSPEEEQRNGATNVRFLSNNKDDIIASEAKEGFYFNNEGLSTGGRIKGQITYSSESPNTPLTLSIKDQIKGTVTKGSSKMAFALQSGNAGQQYLFSVRDFSQNGFQYYKLLLYMLLAYAGIVALLLYFPGKNLVRIEPVIFAVIYLLLTLRFILYWRLATFPPLENISKYELEHTILNFDFDWGIHFPLPLTIIWLYIFLAALAVYRYYTGKGKRIGFSPEERWNLRDNRRINQYYVYFIGICLGFFFINSMLLHIEFLTRIFTIVIPVAGYCYFSMLANKYFQFDADWIPAGTPKWNYKIKAYFHYLIYNPTFIITLLTIAFFALTDRGFAILFALFVLLKNVFFNFLKKPFDSSKTTLKNMLVNPNNYWIYGFLALVAYLVILSFKSLFYYLITYKLVLLAALLAIPLLVMVLFYRSYQKTIRVLGILLGVYLLLLLIPPTRNFMEAKATSAIKHVQYRASIIHQPISKLLAQNPYSSFQTQKIIETAENQWFINAYINKPYDRNATINLRPYSKVGVNYNTQTRDVVIARFVISELGDFTMYLILILTLLPLVLYLISFRLTDAYTYRLYFRSYAGSLPLLIFFTISLFVWLTATNRFVFFGQDFPFLSLTSKLSVVLPLLLFGITLTQQPETYRSYQLNLSANFTRYAFFVVLIAAFALTTIKQNELSNRNFSIIEPQAQSTVNSDLNALLDEVQDSLDARRIRYTYSGLIRTLAEHPGFKTLVNGDATDVYTKSILQQLVQRPNSAVRIDNPLYITFNGFHYSALYNDRLYLHLPPLENKKVWNGTIVQQGDSTAVFALNKWINGRYEILYPLKEQNFWIYHFANAIRAGYEADSMLRRNVGITLDYGLYRDVQQSIDNAYGEGTSGNKGFRFSVIAADGNGNIRLMNDFVTNRKKLDPNDEEAIDKLQQKHFFFSNIRNERDQWGNSNLIALHLGPGSSVKPLTTSAIASQVNAGWESLHMQAPGQEEYESYAGFKLLKPWKNDDHYRSGYLDISRFLEVSSNFYQSAMIFLGSYPREAFIKGNKASIKNVLTTQAGKNNIYPAFEVNGYLYHLPNYNNRKGNWPATDGASRKRTFFGNEASVLSEGLSNNLGLQTREVMAKDTTISEYRRTGMLDSLHYGLLSASKSIYYLWSMPEHASLLQHERSFKEPYQNFNIGLKTTTLGGYPYQVSPFKMLEMYLALFSQNRNFGLSVLPGMQSKVAWKADATWQGSFNNFLAGHIFKGMNAVINGAWGTAHGISGVANGHPGYYFYAKTGTINEQGSGMRNSRRLAVIISNKDMQQAANIGSEGTRLYSFYFAIDNNKDFDWSLLSQIIEATMASKSFREYFK